MRKRAIQEASPFLKFHHCCFNPQVGCAVWASCIGVIFSHTTFVTISICWPVYVKKFGQILWQINVLTCEKLSISLPHKRLSHVDSCWHWLQSTLHSQLGALCHFPILVLCALFGHFAIYRSGFNMRYATFGISFSVDVVVFCINKIIVMNKQFWAIQWRLQVQPAVVLMTKPGRTIPKESVCHINPEFSHRKIKTNDVMKEKLHGFTLHG